MIRKLELSAVAVLAATACSHQQTTPPLPDLPALSCAAGQPSTDRQGPRSAQVSVIATANDGLAAPMGLAFAPDHPDELWVVNQLTNGVVILYDPGTPEQHAETRIDAFGMHFMSAVAGIAFGEQNHFASCQESRDPWNEHSQTTDDFMGPTLWSADLDIFAVVNQVYPKPMGGLEGSHIDMLHESPLCTGIAHDSGNVFWVFDGLNGHLVRYDFVKDHGPGYGNHADGIVRRYVEATVTRVEHVTGQLAFDPQTKLLFAADTGGGRITRLDTSTGTAMHADSPTQKETLHEYSQVVGTRYDVIATGFSQPSGLVLKDDHLLVADHGTGEVVTLDLCGNELDRWTTNAPSLMGLTVSPLGEIYAVDRDSNAVLKVTL